MDIILSWSKRSSRAIATAIYQWLPGILPGIQPWMSDNDISKGSAWFDELKNALGKATSCIICVTPDNLDSSWLYFEAGAIAGKGSDVRVHSFLVGVEPTALANTPLAQFQQTVASKSDTLRLIHEINKGLVSPHHATLINGAFEHHWPTLEPSLTLPILLPVPKLSGEGIFLSADAVALLNAAVQDKQGKIYNNKNAHETMIGTDGRNFVEQNDARSEAQWRGALDSLESNHLIEALASSKEVYRVTQIGYNFADKNKPTPVTTPSADASDSQASVADSVVAVVQFLEVGLKEMQEYNCGSDIHRLFALGLKKLQSIYVTAQAAGIETGQLREAIVAVQIASNPVQLQQLGDIQRNAFHAIKLLKEEHRFLTC